MPKQEEQREEEEGQQAIDQMSFPDIGPDEPETSAEQEAGAGKQPDPAELQARLEALEKERERYEQQLSKSQETIDRLIQGQMAQPPAQQKQPDQGIDMSDLPDPVENAQAFKQALQQKIMQATQSATQQSQSQLSESQKLKAMWDEFQSEYTDLAEHEPVVESFVRREADRLQARGIDPKQAMLQDPDGFKERVAKSSREYLQNKIGGGKKEQEPDPKRTAGVSAGSPGSGGSKKAEKPVPSFIDDLKKSQVESGFF